MTADVRVQAVASSRAGWDLPDQLSSTISSKFIGILRGVIPKTGKKTSDDFDCS